MTSLTRKTVMLTVVLVLLIATVAANITYAQAPGASGVSGIIVTKTQLGYPFVGSGNYRFNGPTLLRSNDAWVPLHVTLQNAGETDSDATLIVSDNNQQAYTQYTPYQVGYHTDYTLNVSLAAGARKAVTLYLRATDFSAQQQMTLELRSGNSTLSSQTIQLNQLENGVLAVGVLSDDSAARTAFQALTLRDTNSTRDAGIKVVPAQLGVNAPLDPQPQALENFDLIVLSNYASDQLNSAQLAALHVWVQEGGTLLVAGGPDAQKTMGHLPPDLLPVTLQSSIPRVVASAPELATLSGDTVATNGPIDLSVARPVAGAHVLAAHAGLPLAVDKAFGRGHLVYIAVEPTLAPVYTWSADTQSHFWQHLLAPALAGPLDTLVESNTQNNPVNNFGLNSQNKTITDDLTNLPSRSLPSIQLYAILIVAYILTLGPINFYVLRRRRRLEWSWITLPVLAVLFGIGSFGMAYARNGGDVTLNVDSVVYFDPGAPTKLVDSYVGVFVPFAGDYDLGTTGSALVWALANSNNSNSSFFGTGSSGSSSETALRVDEDAPTHVRLLNMQMWSQRSIALQQQLPISGQITGKLVFHHGTVAGSVTNATSLLLRDCVVVGLNGSSAQIARLAPSQTARVTPFSLNEGNYSSSSNSGSAGPLNGLYAAAVGGGPGLQAAGTPSLGLSDRYNTVLNALFPSGNVATANTPLTLVCWSDQPLGDVTVNGSTPHRNDLDLIIAPLDLSVATGSFTLQPGDLPVRVVDTSTTGGNGGGPGSSLTLNAGDFLDTALTVPAAGRSVRLDTVTIQANSQGNQSFATDSGHLWNWKTGRWDTIDLSSGQTTVNHASAFISSSGQILLRITPPSGGSISFTNIAQGIQIGATGAVQ